MGLDMNLYKDNYVKNFVFEKVKHEVTVKQNGKTRKDIKPERTVLVREDVIYWRKANMIHGWFVEHCADGNEDRTLNGVYVDIDDLYELLKTVNKVLDSIELVDGMVDVGPVFSKGKVTRQYAKGKVIKDPTVAKKLLPTHKGFFYGTTDYNETYYEDLVYTKEKLEEVIADYDADKAVDFRYEASW